LYTWQNLTRRSALKTRFTAVLALMLLAAVTLFAEGGAVEAGGGCHERSDRGVTDGTGTSVAIEKCAYLPNVVRVQTGDTVRWHNKEEALHTVTGVAGSWGTFEEYELGESVSYTFDESGVYPYFCELHPGMVGAVIVGDGAAAAGNGGKGVLAVSEPGDVGSEQAAASDSEVTDDGGGSSSLVIIALGTALAAALIGGVALAMTGRLRLRG
jgi:plastocyanin